MNATMTQQALASAPTPTVAGAIGVSGAPRTLLRLEGAVAMLGAALAYPALGGRWSMFALLFLLPDLSMLGYLAGRRVGAAAYNAAHSYLGPAMLAVLGAAFGAHGLLCLACIWTAHVGVDRLLGYGLKYGTSFGDTHLGRREGAK
ncbi:MAG TPA: DUF4260 domain-containing protein [Polyangiaceae bacterium]